MTRRRIAPAEIRRYHRLAREERARAFRAMLGAFWRQPG